MKVLHTISGIWEHTGGPAESVPRLCSSLLRNNVDITVLTLNGRLSSAALECQKEGVEIISLPHYREISLRVFSESRSIARDFDIIHGHGLWETVNWATGRAAIRNGKPLIITPRGSLNPNALKHSRVKKRLAAFMFDNRYLRYAQCIHVTSDAEYRAIRRYGLTNPVAVIPNGVQPKPPGEERISRHAFREKHAIPGNRKILLYLSRISWEKGLEDLADAWRRVAPDFPEWQLVIAGPGEQEYIRKLRARFDAGMEKGRVSWLGPLYDDEKAAAYAGADLFVLPSHSENFSLVVAEALAAGLPVITTQGTPWNELPEKGCGWWVPIGADGVSTALREAFGLHQDELEAIGAKAKSLIDHKYSWPVIARQMEEVYAWVLGGHDLPACMMMD